MRIETIETPSLGDRSYVVHDGTDALVVDPQRDVDRVLELLDHLDLRCRAVFETHVHNDYVTGGRALAEATGADYHVAADEDLAFDRVPVADGDEVKVGSLVVRAVHTPGHTPTHLSYVVSSDGVDRAVLTGGGLLYGSVGRPDLIGPEMTEPLARAQHRSARVLADQLADDVAVLPTHGFGSFCSAGEVSGADTSTIGQERAGNHALTTTDEDAFVAELLAGLDTYPAYYAHMGPANRQGPDAPTLAEPTLVDVTELRRRIHAGEWVVDLRSRRAFAAGHLQGSLGFEASPSLSTYLGWLIPWGTPVTFVGESVEQVAEAQRELARIGIDEVVGRAAAEALEDADTVGYPIVDFAGLAAADAAGEVEHVVDLRRRLEWEAGHIDGAVHLPLHDLLKRMDELPDGRLHVHCQGGYRASVGASVLHRAGRDVVLVDDEFDHAAEHFTITT